MENRIQIPFFGEIPSGTTPRRTPKFQIFGARKQSLAGGKLGIHSSPPPSRIFLPCRIPAGMQRARSWGWRNSRENRSCPYPPGSSRGGGGMGKSIGKSVPCSLSRCSPWILSSENSPGNGGREAQQEPGNSGDISMDLGQDGAESPTPDFIPGKERKTSLEYPRDSHHPSNSQKSQNRLGEKRTLRSPNFHFPSSFSPCFISCLEFLGIKKPQSLCRIRHRSRISLLGKSGKHP